MKGIKIILLHRADWKIYKTIQLEALKNDPQSFGASYDEWINFSDEKWQERPSNKDSMIFIAQDEERPMGLVGIHFEEENGERSAHIWGMYVNKDYRGLGLGKQLLQQAFNTIKDTSLVRKVKLMVEFNPTPAQKLYRSLGFQETGTVDYTLGDKKEHKLYKMEKLLG